MKVTKGDDPWLGPSPSALLVTASARGYLRSIRASQRAVGPRRSVRQEAHLRPLAQMKRLGQSYEGRATITGIRAEWATAALTDPSSIPANPPRPWLPTITSCASSDCLTR